MNEKQQGHEGSRLRRVGAMWKPKPGAKSFGSGSLTVNGLRQRFVVLSNQRKLKDTDPDFVLMSSDEPEVDQYAHNRQAVQGHGARPAPGDPAPF